MTTAKSQPTHVVVVDGSNIATEGRSMPSLTQLNDAVMAFREEYPDAAITVVVDATFGHRIDKRESAEFDAAVAHNELVAPPAGAIGRGDAFVLSIANKVGARILSNDSFQEFHGTYPWLFDEGRLIGGKPVPNIGWVFVDRLPVKGAVSRKAQRAARGRPADAATRPPRRTASKEASQPMPVPTAPPPGVRRGRPAAPEVAIVEDVATANAAPPGSAVNELLPFLEFVEHHPVGSSVNGVVESYSSHGAYVSVGDVRGYVPLRLMGDPPPRSAREVMKVGDAVTLVVMNFAPSRRSIDLGVPAMAPGAHIVPTPQLEELAEAVTTPAPKRTRKKAAAEPAPAPPAEAPPAPSRRRVAKKVAPLEPVAVEEAVPEPPAKKRPAAKKAAAKKAAAPEKVAAEPAPAPVKKAAAKKAAAPAKKAAPKKAATKEVAVQEAAPAKRTRARKASAGEAPA